MRSQRARGWVLAVGILSYAWLSFTDWVRVPSAAPNAHEQVVLLGAPPAPEAAARAAPALSAPPARTPTVVPARAAAPPAAARVQAETTQQRVKQRYVDRFDPRRNDY